MPDHMLPGLHIKASTGESILIDAGEGTQLQLSKAEISINRIDAILITHMHGDHVFGLPGLLENMSLTGRTKPLLIIGPRGLDDYLVNSFQSTYFAPRYKLYYLRVRGFGSTNIGKLRIEWFPACHTVEAYGYKVVYYKRPKLSKEKLAKKGLYNNPLTSTLLEKGRIKYKGKTITLEEVMKEPGREYCIAYTGDTAPCTWVLEAVSRCDLLFHEATFASDHQYEAWAYGHSTAGDAALIAREAGVGKLVLYHYSTRYKENYNVLLEEARNVFLHTELGADLAEYTV
ncbi:MAG: ribonuclease Z [Desulfurococcales archaeon]|nr:ribonuclease Z [Desulfurococcales archaeon]